MTAALHAPPPLAAPRVMTGRRTVVRELARIEARRLLRSPVAWLGVLLSTAFVWGTLQAPNDWSGARYTSLPIFIGPVAAAISMAVSGAFLRERTDADGAHPVDEQTRTLGRLTGSLVWVAVVLVVTAVGALVLRWYGGFDLGDEPGRTLHAHYSWPELLQPACLALLAVGAGALTGRRMRRRAAATLTLFVVWFPITLVPWAFQSPRVAPFSILQIQPLTIDVGPADTDPLSLPASWLLLTPGEYQDYWGRAFTSVPLGVGHDLWLLGLAVVLVGLALPRRRLLTVVPVGALLAAAGVALQYAVIP